MNANAPWRCRNWCLVVVLLFLGLAVVVWMQPLGQNAGAAHEPAHNGRTLSEWLMEASTVPDDNDPGRNAIQEIGPSAVPYLARAFREGRLPRRVQRQGRDVQRWEIQDHAAQALKALGPAAAAAVPTLIECLRDGDKRIRSEAAQILGKTGVATKPVRGALLLALNDEDTAYHAAQALGVLGRKETNLVYELIGVAGSGKKPAAYWATVALVDLGTKAAPALPVLIELSRNPSPDSDWEAVKAIGMIGPDAAAAVPSLVRVVEAGGPWARKCAVISLGRIGPAATASLPVLRLLLEKEDERYTKADIARSLWRIDPGQLQPTLATAQSIVEKELLAASSEGRISFGLMSALDLLGELGTNALRALPMILESTRFDDPHVQLCAAWAAWQVEPAQTSLATNVLWKLAGIENYSLEDFKTFTFLAEAKRERESYHIRIAALAMLWQIEPESRTKVKPVMEQLLKRWTYWTGMKRIIPEDQVLAPVLKALLSDDSRGEIHALVQEVLDQVTSADAERW